LITRQSRSGSLAAGCAMVLNAGTQTPFSALALVALASRRAAGWVVDVVTA